MLRGSEQSSRAHSWPWRDVVFAGGYFWIGAEVCEPKQPYGTINILFGPNVKYESFGDRMTIDHLLGHEPLAHFRAKRQIHPPGPAQMPQRHTAERETDSVSISLDDNSRPGSDSR